MSKLLCELLGSEPHKFNALIARLESATLNPGTDISLSTDILRESKEKVRALGLDPKDSTDEELYNALLEKVRKDSATLRAKLNMPSDIKSSEMARKIAVAVQKLVASDKVISLQPPTVKKLLISVPPKKTLRALKFRSVDAVLKREDPMILYSLAKLLEDKSWHVQISARLKRLQAREVVETNVRVLSLPEPWITKLKEREFASVLFSIDELGSVLILPSMPTNLDGSALLTTALVLQAAQKLAVESLPYRMKALSVGLEKLVSEISVGYSEEINPVHGLQPSWLSIYQILASKDSINSEFDFILSDLSWQTIESKLALLSPELDFWVNSHYLGCVTGGLPVSFHVVDVAASLVLKRKFGKQIVTHLKSSLWNEIQVRYMTHSNIENAVISQLSIENGTML